MKHTMISFFNICTQFFITLFPQWDIFDETPICLILILTTDSTVRPAVTKSLCYITLEPICLTLFLAFAAVTLEGPCPPEAIHLRAWWSVMVHSVLTSESFKSRCEQRSNRFLKYFVLRISAFSAILYMSCSSQSTITLRIFLGHLCLCQAWEWNSNIISSFTCF